VLHVPVYDYFTADGVRLEGRGVTPDIAVPPDQAPAAARKLLLSGLPGTPE
jgi:C-terminal processing protease CtpA/Prc